MLVVLPLIGLVVGGMIGGQGLAMWLAVAGFVVALAIVAVSAVALFKARSRR